MLRPVVLHAQVAEKLQEYLGAIDALNIPEAEQECDFIISSVQDDSLRCDVATAVYRHFRDSRLMGSENVAVHVYDRWFSDFSALFPTIDEYEEAHMHAFINRNSLIGAEAPLLELDDLQGERISLPEKGRVSVIFFYSAKCPKCLYAAGQLCDLFSRRGIYSKTRLKGLKLDFYAVYAGDDNAEWAAYVQKNFKMKKRRAIRVRHLCAGDADIVSTYAVIQTPRLFLVDEKGRIAGRQLDVPALCKLLR